METNLDENNKIESSIQFSPKLLNIVWYIGIIGAVLSVIPFVFTIDDGFPFEEVAGIGEKLAIISEIIFISLITYKIYKDGITKPSYKLLIVYSGVMFLDFFVSLFSEDLGSVISLISLILSIVTGIFLLMNPLTKKIGIWLLICMASGILLLAITGDDFENTQKWVGIALAAIYCGPYAKYLESCQKFLCKDNYDYIYVKEFTNV